MKKFMRNILTTSAIATGLVFAGSVAANADTTTAPAQQPNQSATATAAHNYGYRNVATSYTTATTTKTTSTSYTGTNLKQYVLSQMAAQTGVSEATWNTIITRESNWEPYVVNSTSGAYGLFQNMHISSGSVEAQVSAAISLYKAQGLSAWGY